MQWAFGVTCWEVFSLGRTPYPTVPNSEIFTYISKGERLIKPALCPEEMYALSIRLTIFVMIFTLIHRFAVMSKCWEHRPEDRPNFVEITVTVSEYWDDKYGYI